MRSAYVSIRQHTSARMRPRFVLSASYTAEELLFYIFFPFLVTHAVRIVLSASYTAYSKVRQHIRVTHAAAL